MASVAITDAWSDPTAGLTADQTYIVQNKSTGVVQFFEGATFDASTNANDGVLLAPMYDGGSAANSMRWSYNSSNQVRMKMTASAFGGPSVNLVEFAAAS